MSDSIHAETACQEISYICWQGTHTVTHTHSPKRQTRGCRSRQSESVPSWCWTRHPECPAETTHIHRDKGEVRWEHTHTFVQIHTCIHTTDLDHLLSINDFEFLQVFFEEFRSSPPLEQPQQAHWRGETHGEHFLLSCLHRIYTYCVV